MIRLGKPARELDISEITKAVRRMCISANYNVPDGSIQALKKALETEESGVGREVLARILENHRIAREECLAACQDTGVAMVFVEAGQDVRFVGGELYDAINEGVRQGYRDGYLRKSVVTDPLFERVNTGDNTPAFIYVDIVPGRDVKITVAAKGGGEDLHGIPKFCATSLKAKDNIEEFLFRYVVKPKIGNPHPGVAPWIASGHSRRCQHKSTGHATCLRLAK
jgi:fumarate hydratase subunit alpha